MHKVKVLKKQTIILLVFLFSLLHLSPNMKLTPASGIQFTSTHYWFYVSETGIIDYPEMTFTIKNDQAFPIELHCTHEEFEGIDIDVNFAWKNITLEPYESVMNHYSFDIVGNLSATVDMRIIVYQRPADDSGAQLAAGAIIPNRIVYYSEEEGAFLSLRIMDQAATFREANVLIKYQVNNSMPLTPFKAFNGTQFHGVVPKGTYQIQAWDTETSIYGVKTVDITENNTEIDLVLQLIGFDRFLPQVVDTLGLNTTIFNHVGLIDEVEIFAELYLGDEKIAQTNSFISNPYPQVRKHELVLWFPEKDLIYNKRVIIRGVIIADGVLVAEHLHAGITLEKDIGADTGEILVAIFGSAAIVVTAVVVNKRRNI